MRLEGSCHCRAVRFSVDSPHPYPYMRCYCSICRKTAGGGGYAINLSGDAATLEIAGEENLGVYQARLNGGESPARRHFCRTCGSALWLFDPRWPELVHPHASAIDTELPVPPQRVHIMVDPKPAWVEVDRRENDLVFDEYPEESIADWHERHGLADPE